MGGREEDEGGVPSPSGVREYSPGKFFEITVASMRVLAISRA
jgi:hypothetical protein